MLERPGSGIAGRNALSKDFGSLRPVFMDDFVLPVHHASLGAVVGAFIAIAVYQKTSTS